MLKSFSVRWVGGVVGPQDFCVSPWHFDNGASSKIDDVLAEDGGLLHVLPLAVHLNRLKLLWKVHKHISCRYTKFQPFKYLLRAWD